MAASIDELMGMGMPAELAKRVGHMTYAGDPTNNLVPHCIGQECRDTTNSDWYVATSAAAAGWKITAT